MLFNARKLLSKLKPAKKVYPQERRHQRKKRDFIESIYTGQQTKIKREDAMEIITYTLIRIRKLHESCGYEEVINVIFGVDPK